MQNEVLELTSANSSVPAEKIAVLIPCYNEEASIASVVNDFQTALPTAKIYVYDNNSSDRTVEVAKTAGAIVRSEMQQGKGNVVRRMFADIDSDIYVLVDGDNTYDAFAAPKLVEKLVRESLDMVTGSRISENKNAYRPGHKFGNWLLTNLVTSFFGKRTNDMLSGYRVFSRRFVKSFPALSRGFEIETELTVHALELRMPICDVETAYIERLPGSVSKLNTFRDGLRILSVILSFVKEERPRQFFNWIAASLICLALVLGVPILVEFTETGLVPRFPTAILSASIVIIALMLFVAGLILETVTLGRRETKRLFYLSYKSINSDRGK